MRVQLYKLTKQTFNIRENIPAHRAPVVSIACFPDINWLVLSIDLHADTNDIKSCTCSDFPYDIPSCYKITKCITIDVNTSIFR